MSFLSLMAGNSSSSFGAAAAASTPHGRQQTKALRSKLSGCDFDDHIILT